MRLIKIILLLQLALGLVGAYVAYWDIHSAAMGIERGREMNREFELVRQSPEYREPPAIRGYSQARFIGSIEDSAYKSSRIAFRAFSACLAASLFAAVLLWLLRREGQVLKS